MVVVLVLVLVVVLLLVLVIVLLLVLIVVLLLLLLTLIVVLLILVIVLLVVVLLFLLLGNLLLLVCHWLLLLLPLFLLLDIGLWHRLLIQLLLLLLNWQGVLAHVVHSRLAGRDGRVGNGKLADLLNQLLLIHDGVGSLGIQAAQLREDGVGGVEKGGGDLEELHDAGREVLELVLDQVLHLLVALRVQRFELP